MTARGQKIQHESNTDRETIGNQCNLLCVEKFLRSHTLTTRTLLYER